MKICAKKVLNLKDDYKEKNYNIKKAWNIIGKKN